MGVAVLGFGAFWATNHKYVSVRISSFDPNLLKCGIPGIVQYTNIAALDESSGYF